jgi:hypothetical protein
VLRLLLPAKTHDQRRCYLLTHVYGFHLGQFGHWSFLCRVDQDYKSRLDLRFRFCGHLASDGLVSRLQQNLRCFIVVWWSPSWHCSNNTLTRQDRPSVGVNTAIRGSVRTKSWHSNQILRRFRRLGFQRRSGWA